MRIFLATIAGASLFANVALADDYPSRPIHVLTTSSAGGISDIFMRVLGEELNKRLGQPLIIENRPGGSGNIASRLPGCAAGRLHDLHHQCRSDDL
jgi:tripartite-type tricarboxylate transporter receptor subunit TctC